MFLGNGVPRYFLVKAIRQIYFSLSGKSIHVIWVCKCHRKILNPGVVAYVGKLLPKLLREMPGIEIKTIGFNRDHLYMVMVIAPNIVSVR